MATVLSVEHVYKSFGHRPVVSDVSLSVNEGEILGFLGPNGAGKTTTIKMILGLLGIDSGTVSVCGHDVETDFEAAMSCVSGIVENPDMYPYLSGYDNLRLHARANGVPVSRIMEVTQMVGMQNRIRNKFKSYSLGMKQRLGIAQALLHDPRILILDEPTNGLDPSGIKEVRDLLKYLTHEKGISVLVSSHILREMQELCDRVCIINRGTIQYTGTMEELLKRSRDAGVYRYALRPTEEAQAFLQAEWGDRIRDVAAEHIDLSLSEAEVPVLNRQLMEHHIDIYALFSVGTSLEQSFMEITGGGAVIG